MAFLSLSTERPKFVELILKFVFVFERSILGVELVLEPPSFVCYCWRKRLDTVEIGWIQIGRASNTKQENIEQIFYEKY